MDPMGVRLFALGFSAGLTTLTMSAYRRASPRWLRWLLLGSGLLVMGRYAALAAQPPLHDGLFRIADAGSLIGLTLPGIFAIDQVLRHPALSPKILLRWYAPFAILVSGWLLLRAKGSVGDQVLAIQGLSSLSIAGACLLVMRRFPVPAARRALLGLVLGYLGCAMVHLLPVPLFLLAELPILLALWYAYEVAGAGL